MQRRLRSTAATTPRHDHAPRLGAGDALPTHTRVDLEHRLGAPLHSIRIHTDDSAADAARSMGALAFTNGRHIAFARGQYAPESPAGDRLLVHELVHATRHGGSDTLFRKCGPNGFPPAPDTCEFSDAVPEGRRFSYRVNCDTPKDGQQAEIDALAKRLPDGARVHVTGLASAEGDREYNRSLSCHRADDAAARLATAGAAIGNIKAAGPIGAAGDDNNRAVVVEVEGGVTPKPDPPPKPVENARLCGPAMDTSIDATLADVRSRFAGFTKTQREDNCAQLVSLNLLKKGGFVNAWDIDEFFVNDSGWLDKHPVHPPCCNPLDPADVESKNTCGRTIEVGGKCFLAGTANYVLFGQISRLCFDEFPKGLSKFGGLVLITYDRAVTLNRVTAYKVVAIDDPGPPKEWTAAGFDGFPANKGSTSNRPECPAACPYKHPTMVLTWIWEPNRPR